MLIPDWPSTIERFYGTIYRNVSEEEKVEEPQVEIPVTEPELIFSDPEPASEEKKEEKEEEIEVI